MRCALAGPRVHREQQSAGRIGDILAAFPRRPERGKPEGHCLSSLILQPCAERGAPTPPPEGPRPKAATSEKPSWVSTPRRKRGSKQGLSRVPSSSSVRDTSWAGAVAA